MSQMRLAQMPRHGRGRAGEQDNEVRTASSGHFAHGRLPLASVERLGDPTCVQELPSTCNACPPIETGRAAGGAGWPTPKKSPLNLEEDRGKHECCWKTSTDFRTICMARPRANDVKRLDVPPR